MSYRKKPLKVFLDDNMRFERLLIYADTKEPIKVTIPKNRKYHRSNLLKTL